MELRKWHDKQYFWLRRTCKRSAESNTVRVHPTRNFNLLMLTHLPFPHVAYHFACLIAYILLVGSISPKLNTFCYMVRVGSIVST